MNGPSKNKSASSYTQPYTHANKRKITLEDQRFDNVFYQRPYGSKEDFTVEGNIRNSKFNESGEILSQQSDSEISFLDLFEKTLKDNEDKAKSSFTSLSSRKENKPFTTAASKTKRIKTSGYKQKRLPLENLPNNNNNLDLVDSTGFQVVPVACNSETDIPADSIFEFEEIQGVPESDANFSLVNHLIKSRKNRSGNFNYENMMAEYKEDQSYHHVTNGDSMPDCNVATLLNMGNTCFMNSVLYTLRFAPTFLHNLHHLLVDLSLINSKLKENKTKTSSLGRNGSAVSGNSWRSTSSKDLLSIGNNDIIPKSKDQIVTEKLHALFVTMNNLETKGTPDPYQPEALLQAMRDANTLFEGNQQQDAHEFFVELLSCLRVTCDKLNAQIEQNPDLIKSPELTSANVNNNSKIWGVRRSWKKPLKKKEKSTSKKNGDIENDAACGDSEDSLSNDVNGDSGKKKLGYNFIAEDFQGVSLHRTTCLQCEEVSELKEPFLEIQVPINYRDEDFDSHLVDSSIFGTICVTSEKLCDQNKYFCEICMRYNEAERTVLYEKLPNIMVLHLKRFTTSQSGVQKVNTYVPTPLEIRCFCESCNKIEQTKITPHKYQLSCVIMHLGASMASGHYIAYSRASVETYDYIDCNRDIPKSYLSSSSKELSANILKFFKGKASGNSLSETNGIGLNSKKNDTQVCQSINCCGIRCKLNLGSPSHNDDWLEFDDEKVKILSNKEFMDMLNRRHDSTNTPYLLFYSKVE